MNIWEQALVEFEARELIRKFIKEAMGSNGATGDGEDHMMDTEVDGEAPETV